EAGPQGLVASHDRGQRTLQGGDVDGPLEAMREEHVVGGAAPLEAAQNPETALRAREHITRSSFNWIDTTSQFFTRTN
ncbi:hypothetical protein QEH53_23780, partial [Pelagicoccus sp. SDUM812002]